MKVTKHLSLALIVAGLLASGVTVSAKPKKDKEIIEQLQKGTPLHMPFRAAAIVRQAAASEQKALALRVLTHSVALKPQLAASFVSNLSQAVPAAKAELISQAMVQAPSQRENLAELNGPTPITTVAMAPSAPSSSQVQATGNGIISGPPFSPDAHGGTKLTTREAKGSEKSSRKHKKINRNQVGRARLTSIQQGGPFTQ